MIELIMAIALSGICILMIASVLLFSKRAELSIATRGALIDLKSVIIMALASESYNGSAKLPCKAVILPISGSFNVISNTPPGSPVPIKIQDPRPTLVGQFIIQNGQTRDLLRYGITLENWRFIQQIPATNIVHREVTNQFVADLVIRGDRTRGVATPNRQVISFGADVLTERVPMLFEFSNSDNLIYSCSL